MKRIAVAIPDICTWDNLARAFYQAAAGKRDSLEVRAFVQDFDARLARIADRIIRLELPVSDPRRFVIHDPKRRIIHAPCFEDRVIHHAIMNLAGLLLDRAMTDYTFACRKGKGVHAAVRQVQANLRRFRWYVKIDIENYFATIDHNNLLALLARKFKGKPFLFLLEKIIYAYHARPGQGLPIGALTSQHCANFYLDRLDRFVMENCRALACVRYMDDMMFWCDTKFKAELLLKKVRRFVESVLLLTVKNSQVQIQKSDYGVLFCGYRIYPGVIRLSQRKKRRYIRLRKKWEQWFVHGMISESELARGYDAVSASLRHADSRQWRKLQLKKSGAPVW
ncbi:reverse transcriptase/maturase family protein [uncultured Desulfobacter sp.]|uniref:reverse transcriptase/maturase family protein n=1 Tax=uncultured Desulfobacter sp. TaxID=240139 RepID=UPI0029F48B67|nr:reverse transcriptase/maturase family protein [uncultured Desulfobacter sp.]